MIDPISWAHSWPYILAGFAAAYLLGSIPFGQVLTKLAGLGDVRKIGSGNIGATNVLRTGNKKLAATTLVLDGAKGAVAVLFADIYGPDIAIVAAAGALLGHLFPVWLKFRKRASRPRLAFFWRCLCRSVGRMRHLAAGSRFVSVFVPVRSAGHGGGPIHVVARRSAAHGVRRRDGDTGLDTSPSEHPTPDTQRRVKDRFFRKGYLSGTLHRGA